MTPSRVCLFSFVFFFLGDDSARAELTVRTDFAGGSARLVTDIDQENKIIRIRPGGNPSRGWPCW